MYKTSGPIQATVIQTSLVNILTDVLPALLGLFALGFLLAFLDGFLMIPA